MDALTDEDRNHLHALQIGHYVYAALLAMLAMIGPLLVAIGLLVPWPTEPDGPPPWFFPIYFGIIGSIFLFIYGPQAAVTFFAARCIQQRRRWRFCMIVGCIACTWVPIGTVLGTLSIMVLARPNVQAAFRPTLPPPVPPPLPAIT